MAIVYVIKVKCTFSIENQGVYKGLAISRQIRLTGFCFKPANHSIAKPTSARLCVPTSGPALPAVS